MAVVAAIGSANVKNAQVLTRSVDKIFEEAQLSGALSLHGRNLKNLPNVFSRYDLSDTVEADLSDNRFADFPVHLCGFISLETLYFYNNCLRSIPIAVQHLRCLTYLDLSRNQLQRLPEELCSLPLEVLLLGHNCLQSLCNGMRHLSGTLMELDVSCNKIETLPTEMGRLKKLRVLNVKENLLTELPSELCSLCLNLLDLSCNQISRLNVDLRHMHSLVYLLLNENPLVFPSPKICRRGKVHIFKALENEANKHFRRHQNHDGHDSNNYYRRSSSTTRCSNTKSRLIPTDPEDFKYVMNAKTEKRKLRHHTIAADSGYSTNSEDSSKASSNQTTTPENNQNLLMDPLLEHDAPDSKNIVPLQHSLHSANVVMSQSLYSNTLKSVTSRKSLGGALSPVGRPSSFVEDVIATCNERIENRNSLGKNINPAQTYQSPSVLGCEARLVGNGLLNKPRHQYQNGGVVNTMMNGCSSAGKNETSSRRHCFNSSAFNMESLPDADERSLSPALSKCTPERQAPSYSENHPTTTMNSISKVEPASTTPVKHVVTSTSSPVVPIQINLIQATPPANGKLNNNNDLIQDDVNLNVSMTSNRSSKFCSASTLPDQVTVKVMGKTFSASPLKATGVKSDVIRSIYCNSASPKPLESLQQAEPAHLIISNGGGTLKRPSTPVNFETTPSDQEISPPDKLNNQINGHDDNYANFTAINNNNANESSPPLSIASSRSSDKKNEENNGNCGETIRSTSLQPALQKSSRLQNQKISPVMNSNGALKNKQQRPSLSSSSSSVNSTSSRLKISPSNSGGGGGVKGQTVVNKKLSLAATKNTTVTNVRKTSSPSPAPPTTRTNSSVAPKIVANSVSKASSNGNVNGERKISLERQPISRKSPPTVSSTSNSTKNEKLLADLRNLFKDKLNLELPSDQQELAETLSDGIHLCNLLNYLRPKTIRSVHMPSDSIPKMTMAKRNVENFLIGCRRFGLNETNLCSIVDVVEKKNVVAVGKTIFCLQKQLLISQDQVRTVRGGQHHPQHQTSASKVSTNV